MLGKIEGMKRSGRQDEMVGWHHRLSGHELEQTLRDGEGQGSLACCSTWGHRVRHDLVTNNNNDELIYKTETDSQTWRMNLTITREVR